MRITASLLSRRHSLVENANIVKTVYTKDPLKKIKNIENLKKAIPGNFLMQKKASQFCDKYIYVYPTGQHKSVQTILCFTFSK